MNMRKIISHFDAHRPQRRKNGEQISNWESVHGKSAEVFVGHRLALLNQESSHRRASMTTLSFGSTHLLSTITTFIPKSYRRTTTIRAPRFRSYLRSAWTKEPESRNRKPMSFFREKDNYIYQKLRRTRSCPYVRKVNWGHKIFNELQVPHDHILCRGNSISDNYQRRKLWQLQCLFTDGISK